MNRLLLILTLLITFFNSCSCDAYRAKSYQGACFLDDTTLVVTAWEYDAYSDGSLSNENVKHKLYTFSLVDSTLTEIATLRSDEGMPYGAGGLHYSAPWVLATSFGSRSDLNDLVIYNMETGEKEVISSMRGAYSISNGGRYLLAGGVIYDREQNKNILVYQSNKDRLHEFHPYFLDENKGVAYGHADWGITSYTIHNAVFDTIRIENNWSNPEFEEAFNTVTSSGYIEWVKWTNDSSYIMYSTINEYIETPPQHTFETPPHSGTDANVNTGDYLLGGGSIHIGNYKQGIPSHVLLHKEL